VTGPATVAPAAPIAPIAPVAPVAPVAPMPDSLLGVLRLTLAELHEAVVGEAGVQVRTLKQRTGTIADIVRRGVALISELMVALAKGMEVAGNLILGADAVFALLEVVLDTLDAMVYAVGGTVAYLTSKQEDGEAQGSPDLGGLEALRGPLAEAKAFLADSGMVADLMPRPAEVFGVRKEIARLLGSRVDPTEKTTGSLGALEAAIAVTGAPPPAPANGSANISAPKGGPQGS
jgi:hypothetical protein